MAIYLLLVANILITTKRNRADRFFNTEKISFVRTRYENYKRSINFHRVGKNDARKKYKVVEVTVTLLGNADELKWMLTTESYGVKNEAYEKYIGMADL